ncbi:response regulator transcription factor [Chelatococcus reniformis]|uniref:DNA-binding response regulator n=1 Tax=Chelatococcus reniformis TaxID=1494448 RepID=A0A916UVC1_9HYPH|nr:response regulator [Chelatococcus reniformis]GGC88823.1 DNA-binding response regulator [Chelatococcus reniformis]
MSESQHETCVCVIDDDEGVRQALDSLLRSAGFTVHCFETPEAFLAADESDGAGCLILDIRLRGANGLDFQQELLASDNAVPVILMTGYGDIPMTVRGMKAGAVNFLAKPFADDDMLAAVAEALARSAERRAASRRGDGLRSSYASLTPREREVMALVTAGLMNKQIAGRLGLSEITVKIHRGNLMRKMQAQSLADLVRMAEALGARETSAARYGATTGG